MQIEEEISKSNKTNWGPILIIGAALLWALDGVIRRHLFTLPPITIIFFEHLIGLIILLPFVYKKVIKTKLEKKDWYLLVLIATLSGVLGTLWFTTALLKVNFITLSVVFLLQKLQPLFAIASARIFLKEKLKRKYLTWAILALVSAFFVTFPDGIINLKTGAGTVIAAFFALGAAFAWGTSTTFSKMILKKVDSNVSAFYRFLLTVLIAFPLLLIMKVGNSLGAVTLSQFGFLALIAVSTGMVALLIYYRGLKTTPVHISTILELTFPFIAIFIDMQIYGTVLTISQLIASFVLVLSIYKIAKLREN